ncbi:MAG TPA: hypothetical protein VM865_03180, partial [Acidobacteriaceae bacterium]|nr:hypothetical protein [Acidobacteriaceae bacterium]
MLLLMCSVPGSTQQIQLDTGLDRGVEARKQHVQLLTDSVDVPAGRAQEIELRFRVQPGFHINSHTPHDELLIPTSLQVAGNGVRVGGERYPSGSAFRLPGGGDTLDVYQGEFRVHLSLTAARGESTL